MKWEQIREDHPHQWVVVEAIDATTENGRRVLDQIDLIAAFEDWESAWQRYKTLHHAHKDREYYALHTDRADLDIGVLDTFGRTVTQA